MTIRSLRLVRGLAVFVLLVANPTFAQIVELEPNQSCTDAQFVGAVPGLPATVIGSLDTPPVIPDVDFFRFEATAGERLRIDLRGASTGVGTLPDPYLGFFDSECNLIAISDDFQGLDSRLDIVVPMDGEFVLAAGSCCDPDFAGNGSSAGSYVLGIGVAPEPIGGISGRLVDAYTGEPLPGSSPPFAFASLFACANGFCDTHVAGVSAAPDGTFVFTINDSGIPLEPGDYQVQAFADRYAGAASVPFSVAAGEVVDIGALALTPPTLSLVGFRSCDNLPAAGGVCRYGVRVANNTADPISLRGWSLVNAGGTGSAIGYTVFPANRVRRIDVVGAQQSVDLGFSFVVPADVADGAYFCTDLWLSDDSGTYVDTVDSVFLFCVSKIGGRYVIESDKANRARVPGRRAN